MDKKALSYGLLLVLVVGVVAMVAMFQMSNTAGKATGYAVKSQKGLQQLGSPKQKEGTTPFEFLKKQMMDLGLSEDEFWKRLCASNTALIDFGDGEYDWLMWCKTLHTSPDQETNKKVKGFIENKVNDNAGKKKFTASDFKQSAWLTGAEPSLKQIVLGRELTAQELIMPMDPEGVMAMLKNKEGIGGRGQVQKEKAVGLPQSPTGGKKGSKGTGLEGSKSKGGDKGSKGAKSGGNLWSTVSCATDAMKNKPGSNLPPGAGGPSGGAGTPGSVATSGEAGSGAVAGQGGMAPDKKEVKAKGCFGINLGELGGYAAQGATSAYKAALEKSFGWSVKSTTTTTKGSAKTTVEKTVKFTPDGYSSEGGGVVTGKVTETTTTTTEVGGKTVGGSTTTGSYKGDAFSGNVGGTFAGTVSDSAKLNDNVNKAATADAKGKGGDAGPKNKDKGEVKNTPPKETGKGSNPDEDSFNPCGSLANNVMGCFSAGVLGKSENDMLLDKLAACQKEKGAGGDKMTGAAVIITGAGGGNPDQDPTSGNPQQGKVLGAACAGLSPTCTQFIESLKGKPIDTDPNAGHPCAKPSQALIFPIQGMWTDPSPDMESSGTAGAEGAEEAGSQADQSSEAAKGGESSGAMMDESSSSGSAMQESGGSSKTGMMGSTQ